MFKTTEITPELTSVKLQPRPTPIHGSWLLADTGISPIYIQFAKGGVQIHSAGELIRSASKRK